MIVSNTLKVASFFSGIGGFDLGFEKAGMEVVFQCEIDKHCQKVLRKHWPNVKLHDNILTLEDENVPESDIWAGGFPCQDLSLANQGKRKGLDGARSGLFFKYAELISKRHPRWIVIENVPGLLNSNDGEDFKVVLKTLEELGYCISWRVLDAKYFGTPQRRRRVYIVASYRTIGSSAVLFEQGSIVEVSRSALGKKDFDSSRISTGIGNEYIYAIQHATIGRKPSAGPQAKGFRNDGETYTLDSRGSSDVVCSTNAPFRIRKVAGISNRMDSNRFRAIGNAVAVPIIEWLGKRIIEADSIDRTSYNRTVDPLSVSNSPANISGLG